MFLSYASLGGKLATSLKRTHTHMHKTVAPTGVSVVDVAGCCSDCGCVSSAGGGGGAGGGVWEAALLWTSPASPLVTWGSVWLRAAFSFYMQMTKTGQLNQKRKKYQSISFHAYNFAHINHWILLTFTSGLNNIKSFWNRWWHKLMFQLTGHQTIKLGRYVRQYLNSEWSSQLH